MLFNSLEFLFAFLPLILLLYWSTPSADGKKAISAIGSYIFYGVWSPWFAVLMFATTSVDYFTGRWIEDAPDRRRARIWLALSMVSNLGVLAVFKYYGFFASSVRDGLGLDLPLLEVVLPVGISFYTFESMSYTIDVYRGEVRAIRRLIDYINFIAMFPRLVAGPIVRYSQLDEQLRALPTRLSAPAVRTAIHFFVIGMAKKILVADYVWFHFVNPLWSHPGELDGCRAWAATIGYTVQIYMDFSGYSDMAVGLGHLLGLQLPRNFCLPYRSASMAEFWRRWHISLSTWLRDYLYIPLGGGRGGAVRTQVNLLTTMLLGGLWHGANWTFLAWGGFHGALLAIGRAEF